MSREGSTKLIPKLEQKHSKFGFGITPTVIEGPSADRDVKSDVHVGFGTAVVDQIVSDRTNAFEGKENNCLKLSLRKFVFEIH